MPFLTQGKTNWKYILIVVILAILVGGGIFSWQYLLMPKPKPPVETSHEKYCEKDNDCLFLTFSCCPTPDPCKREPPEVINKSNKERVEKELKSKCTSPCPYYTPPRCFECLNLEDFSPICVNNKCTAKREINCEAYCKAVAKDKSEPCPWISNESLITKENTEKCKCPKIGETANWELYRNEEYSFELKYPEDWEFSETKYPKEMELYVFSVGFIPKGEVYWVEGSPGVYPIKIFVNKSFPEYIDKEKEEQILVNGKLAIKREGYLGLEYEIAFEQPNSLGYYFDLVNSIQDVKAAGNISENEAVQFNKIFNQMLSTFRFLK